MRRRWGRRDGRNARFEREAAETGSSTGRTALGVPRECARAGACRDRLSCPAASRRVGRARRLRTPGGRLAEPQAIQPAAWRAADPGGHRRAAPRRVAPSEEARPRSSGACEPLHRAPGALARTARRRGSPAARAILSGVSRVAPPLAVTAAVARDDAGLPGAGARHRRRVVTRAAVVSVTMSPVRAPRDDDVSGPSTPRRPCFRCEAAFAGGARRQGGGIFTDREPKRHWRVSPRLH